MTSKLELDARLDPRIKTYFAGRGRSRLAESVDVGVVSHPAALAHGLQPVPAVALLEHVDHGCHDASAAGTQLMSDGARATVDAQDSSLARTAASRSSSSASSMMPRTSSECASATSRFSGYGRSE